MSTPSRPIFLSYAREDAVSARRVAEALRSAGLEVWFDENELRGGDAWDAKIRRQIDACALFIPLISEHTQERAKGYFRLEWKLAVDQTHLLAEGVPFVAPVALDDTPESGALVPAEFMRVQWIRLPSALPTPEFVAQIKRLLDAPKSGAARGTKSSHPMESSTDRSAHAAAAPAAAKKSGLPFWAWGAIAALGIGAGVAVVAFRDSGKAEQAPAPAVVAQKPTASAHAEPARATDKSIAVLPFSNLSPDKENEFFADGMHDDLITALVKVRDLRVIARNSVIRFKPGERDLRQIGDELGVGTVLEGTVQRAGNRVRLNVQLIDVKTLSPLWAETYQKDLTDVFAIQSDLAREITGALKANLTSSEQSLLARKPTENTQAYDFYLQARLLGRDLSPNMAREDYERVIHLYDEAISLDPGFALAHAQVSMSHGQMFFSGRIDPTQERRAKARKHLDIARSLAPDAPETAMAEGTYEYSCNLDWVKALAAYRRAERDLPNDSLLRSRIGITERRLGRLVESASSLELAYELDPNDRRAVAALFQVRFKLRRYDEILAPGQRLGPIAWKEAGNQHYRFRAGFAYEGRLDDSLPEFVKLPPIQYDPGGVAFTYLGAVSFGNLSFAEAALADPRMTAPSFLEGTLYTPLSLERAFLAWYRGEHARAKKLAAEAKAELAGRTWNPRQSPAVKFSLARAEAYSGSTVEALRLARIAMTEQQEADAMNALLLREAHGQLLVACGETEEAFSVLRQMMEGPGELTPNEIRHHLVWSRLKDDPRFEQILKSVKPL